MKRRLHPRKDEVYIGGHLGLGRSRANNNVVCSVGLAMDIAGPVPMWVFRYGTVIGIL